MEQEIFEGSDTDVMVSNLLEKGRYEVEVVDIVQFVSASGNKCNKVSLKVPTGQVITDFLLTETSMRWKWRQFLYAIGIRKKGNFQVPKDRIVGSKCLADIGVKIRTLEDGSIIKENKVNSYSPIEQATAPINGVEPEPPINEVIEKPTPEKQTSEEPIVDDEDEL